MRDEYTADLAKTIHKLITSGKRDPSARDIAEAHFKRTTLGGEIVDGVAKRLRKLKVILEDDYGYLAHLVNHKYYTLKEELPFFGEDEARACLPIGRHRVAAGIRLPEQEDDIILQQAIWSGLASGAGKVQAGLDRVNKAQAENILSRSAAKDMQERTKIAMLPFILRGKRLLSP